MSSSLFPPVDEPGDGILDTPTQTGEESRIWELVLSKKEGKKRWFSKRIYKISKLQRNSKVYTLLIK